MNKTQCKYNNRTFITTGVEKSSTPGYKKFKFYIFIVIMRLQGLSLMLCQI